jgi:RNA polymerase sigma-70 factor, ECF subfamily
MKLPREEFKKQYDRHVRPIYRFVSFKVESDDTAKDITSQTFLQGWEVFNSQEVKNPRALFYRIARNLIVDHYRRREENASLENVSLIDDKVNLFQKIEVKSDMEMVKKALSHLNENYQNIIIWRYIDELSFTEIAALTEKSETAVRVTAHRAMRALQQEIKRYEV